MLYHHKLLESLLICDLERSELVNNLGRLLLLGFACVLVACTISPSDVASSQVSGMVIDASTGRPLEGASLQLRTVETGVNGSMYASSAPPVAESETDMTGTFLFKNVPPGRFILINSAFGEVPYLRIMMWKQNKWENVIVDVSAGQTIDLDVLQVCPYSLCWPWPTQK
jgi:hypothetical protein